MYLYFYLYLYFVYLHIAHCMIWTRRFCVFSSVLKEAPSLLNPLFPPVSKLFLSFAVCNCKWYCSLYETMLNFKRPSGSAETSGTSEWINWYIFNGFIINDSFYACICFPAWVLAFSIMDGCFPKLFPNKDKCLVIFSHLIKTPGLKHIRQIRFKNIIHVWYYKVFCVYLSSTREQDVIF